MLKRLVDHLLHTFKDACAVLKDRAACTLSWDGHILNPTKKTTKPHLCVIFNVYPCYQDLWYSSQLNWTSEVKLIWSFMTPHAITDNNWEGPEEKGQQHYIDPAWSWFHFVHPIIKAVRTAVQPVQPVQPSDPQISKLLSFCKGKWTERPGLSRASSTQTRSLCICLFVCCFSPRETKPGRTVWSTQLIGSQLLFHSIASAVDQVPVIEFSWFWWAAQVLSAKAAGIVQGLCEETDVASSQIDQRRRAGLRRGSHIRHKWTKKTT